MMKITAIQLNAYNKNLRYESPQEIIKFILSISECPMVSTSFGTQSAVILHACTQLHEDINVLWCDTGYNTRATYLHAQNLTKLLQLNLSVFAPKHTRGYIEAMLGNPDINDKNHTEFSQIVKLEPFKRALKMLQPDAWFTNIRKEQNLHRNSLDILSLTKDGILKVSPFFYCSQQQIDAYIHRYDLPVELNYQDPVKGDVKRECGIQLF